MKKIIYSLLVCCLLTAVPTLAQNGTWYFGAAGGMSFSPSGTAAAPGSVISQSEGCASIVDASNNVVMYTDGVSIWNGNHVPQGITLSGHPSSTQNVVIVPIPGTDCNRYFIFTVNAAETNYQGTGGNGKGFRVSLATVTGVAPATTVTIIPANLNINMLSGVYANDLCSEKLCAVSDGSGGYWVATHGIGLYSGWSGGSYTGPINTGGEGNFYAVHVTTANNTIPLLASSLVVTNFTSGQHRSTTIGGGHYDGQGQMKFNSAGNRVALAKTSSQELQLYDFNAGTGAFSNQMIMFPFSSTNDGISYGIEFSMSGNFLYETNTFFHCSINQFDLSLGTAAAISASRVVLANSPNYNSSDYYFGALQMGPDGRVYAAGLNKTALDVVNSPDLLACNYVGAGAPIAGTCKLGLPSVLLHSPCEGNYYTECACQAHTNVELAYPVDGTGASAVMLTLNSGSTVKKLKITLVNFTQPVKVGCQLCNAPVTNTYGTITNTPIVAGQMPSLTPATNPGFTTFSREIIWTYPIPQTISQNVLLNLQFPPVNTGCTNVINYCLKVEYIDENCQVCEQAIYVVGSSNGNPPAKLQNEQSSDIEPGQPVKASPDAYMHVFPNPASATVTVQLPGATESGKLQVYNSVGELVLEQSVSGTSGTFDTSSLPDGFYTVRYAGGGNQYVNTLVIQK